VKPTPRRRAGAAPLNGVPFPIKARKAVPFEFVLDALAPLSPWTRSMFGCIAIYAGEKILLILRDKPDLPADNGVWLATAKEHHESLRREFPSMRTIQLFGSPVSAWQVLPAGAADFEEAALHACELVVARDPRIGRIPGVRKKSHATRQSPVSAQRTGRRT
jgi:hypothetical protein